MTLTYKYVKSILPVIPQAQKASILIGLIWQFYLVIITRVVLGKLIINLKPSHFCE